MTEPVDPTRHAEPLLRLAAYLADEPMDPEEVRRLGAELCATLAACAKLGVAHGGVRPENIYVDRQGAFRLGGPGTPPASSDGTADPRGDSPPASGHYGGQPADEGADAYALGALMYALLDGGAPSPGRPPANGDEALRSVVMKAVAPDPAARFATASEMERALLERRVVEVPPEGTAPEAAAGWEASPLPAPEAYPAYAQAYAADFAPYAGDGYAYAPVEPRAAYAPGAEYASAPAAEKRKKLGIGALIAILAGAAALVALAVFLTVSLLRVKAYNDAVALENAGRYVEAIAAFGRMSPYGDSDARINGLGLKLARRCLVEGDAAAAGAALDGVDFEALAQEQKTEYLYERACVDFARGNYGDAFSGAKGLYASPRGEELYAQPLTDFCAGRILAHMSAGDAQALFQEYKSDPLALALVGNGVYQKASALLEAGDPTGAKALFDALGAYENAPDMSKECVYRQALAAFDLGEFDEAMELFKSISAYGDAAYRVDLSLYRRACRFVSERNFEAAFDDFTTLRSIAFEPDDRFVPDHAQDIYARAQALYAKGSYGDAQAGFLALIEYGAGYMSSADYCTLCLIHTVGVSALDKDTLVRLIGFEDAAGLLLADFDIAWAFLEGKWSCSSGSLEFETGVGLTYSLSAPDFGDKWDIRDGTLYFYDSDKPSATKDAYRFTIVSENELECYAFRNGKTYTLKRK